MLKRSSSLVIFQDPTPSVFLSIYPLEQGAVDVVFLIRAKVCHCQVGVTFVLKGFHIMCPVCCNRLVLDELRSTGLVHN